MEWHLSAFWNKSCLTGWRWSEVSILDESGFIESGDLPLAIGTIPENVQDSILRRGWWKGKLCVFRHYLSIAFAFLSSDSFFPLTFSIWLQIHCPAVIKKRTANEQFSSVLPFRRIFGVLHGFSFCSQFLYISRTDLTMFLFVYGHCLARTTFLFRDSHFWEPSKSTFSKPIQDIVFPRISESSSFSKCLRRDRDFDANPKCTTTVYPPAFRKSENKECRSFYSGWCPYSLTARVWLGSRSEWENGG
jgi:hypothetical protein